VQKEKKPVETVKGRTKAVYLKGTPNDIQWDDVKLALWGPKKKIKKRN